jgi:hypothetical protein
MFSRSLAAAIVAAAVLISARASAAADDATLVRVFLADGTSLVSYGEPVRVGDRLVFSMPAAATPNPPLHLVSLPAARVDWDRTNRYAAAARASHYIETQAASDYALLSNRVAQTLDDVSRTPDPSGRLKIVEDARTMLAEWPQNHFNYRAAEVRQMLSMLDEAIADLRAATGASRFNLAISAYADPLAIVEPLLPPPTPQEAIEQVLTAARVVDSAAERTSLLGAALVAIERDKAVLPARWAAATRVETEAAVQTELKIDRAYQALTDRTMRLAAESARSADIKSLQFLLTRARQRDKALGGKRPEAVRALVAAVLEKLDAARQLRLARDRWALRAPALRPYRVSIRAPIEWFANLGPLLENIKALSGSTPSSLTLLEQRAARVSKAVAAIAPPDELSAAHATLMSAAQLAASAAQVRREATVAGDMRRAWDASSAAAGALMLGAKASRDIQALLRPPRLP